jgi:hypothetical protein
LQAGVNVNVLSGIAGGYIQSLISTAAGSLSPSGSATQAGGANSLLASSESAPSLSPFAQLFSMLQQVEQQNPAQYQQVTGQIASNLQSASQIAQAAGNSAQATRLAQLATDFKTASASGQLPNAQDLGMPAGGHHRHHHRYDAAQSASPNSLDPASIIRSALSSAGVTGASSTSSTGSSLTSN